MTWGTSTFLVGSFVCAVSSDLGVLIVGRAVQGVGGALLVPSSIGWSDSSVLGLLAV